MSTATLKFLGAAGTVTGSKYLVTAPSGDQVLVDCGLFQGLKDLRLRNWQALDLDLKRLKAVFLTHAHIDHSGYLPALVKAGFRGPIYCTDATRTLCAILLPDAGYLQEEDARFANTHEFSRHRPALPLYTRQEAETAVRYLRVVPFSKPLVVAPFSCEFVPSGHILGASSVYLRVSDRCVLFSGDLGRPSDLVMPAPTPPQSTDYVVVESTYGDRLHPQEDVEEIVAAIVNRTVKRGGVLLIPAFAVARAQTLMAIFHRLRRANRIPNGVPIFLDSPMAQTATGVYSRFPRLHKLESDELDGVKSVVRCVASVEESKALDADQTPKIIIAGSGMATGGRILHHLKVYGPSPRNTILFVGFQAPGTRGATLLAGGEAIKIHGQQVPIAAEVRAIDSLSAHADAAEIFGWLSKLPRRPRRVFLTHGEPKAAAALRERIENQLHWDCHIPAMLETIKLD